MYSIYTLSDPRDASIRYVGLSKNAYKRYAMHLTIPAKKQTEKDTWIRDLFKINSAPMLSIVETVETREEAQERERYWIQHYFSLDAKLVNRLKVPAPREYLTPKQAAATLEVPYPTVMEWLRNGAMPGYQYGKIWRIKRSELEDWQKKQRNKYQR